MFFGFLWDYVIHKNPAAIYRFARHIIPKKTS